MKTIGLIGGMSWESTVTYYQIMNETIREQLGGLHSAKVLMYSIDFYELEKMQSEGDWEEAGKMMADAAQRLERAGADFILIGANTMHKTYGRVQEAVRIPVLHIAQLTADVLKQQNIGRVGLLGTKYTVTEDFYISKLTENEIETIVSPPERILEINRIIYEELCMGILKDSSRELMLDEIQRLKERGAGGVILGCTEIGLLVHPEDTDVKLFDTTVIHAEQAALRSLE